MKYILVRVSRFLSRKLKYLLDFDWQEACEGYFSAIEFLRYRSSSNTVLIVEPNRYHAEILPGYCHYFHLLGFTVVMLARRVNANSSAFIRLKYSERPTVFAMHPRMMRRVLKDARMQQFDYILYTSSHWAENNGYFGFFCRFIGHCPRGAHGCGLVVHDFDFILPHLESGQIAATDISLLSPYVYKGASIRVINPNYFGDLIRRPLNERRVFITVGSGALQKRNYNILLNAVEGLELHGCRNFIIRVIGKGMNSNNYPNAPSCIEFLGVLDFQELYNQLEAADFILPMLDSNISEHQRYLMGKTTGSCQLILGFSKVPIIEDEFARAYRFSDENAILYKSERLGEGMLQAMLLCADEYDKLREKVDDLQRSIEGESLRNLHEQIYAESE